jgi:hypothetical protein
VCLHIGCFGLWDAELRRRGVSADQSTPLQIGQFVARRAEPLDTAEVGLVGGLILRSEPPLVIVRWHRKPSTFEPEDTLIEVFPLRRV